MAGDSASFDQGIRKAAFAPFRTALFCGLTFVVIVFGRMVIDLVWTGADPANVSRARAALAAEIVEAETLPGIRVIRIDAALSFVNAQHVKQLCLDIARTVDEPPRVLILDCSGINDIDATGVEALSEIITELDATPVTLHLSDVKGPVRDVLHRAGIWQRLEGRLHATAHLAVTAVQGQTVGVSTLRAAGIDERPAPLAPAATTTNT